MTHVFAAWVYPGVLVASAVLLLSGAATLAWIAAHRYLTWVVTAVWALTIIEVATVAIALPGSGAGIVLTAGYLLAALALLPLLGIARLGTPGAGPKEPGSPVLQPDQIARVDAVAAMIVAVAQAAVAWRIYEILRAAQ